jgi:hypothetical protein
MLKLNGVKKYFLSALACLFMLFAAQAMHAQAGPGTVTLGVDTTSVSNGGSDASETLTPGTYTVAINLQGVTGNGGATSFACYVTNNGNTVEYFYGSVTQSGLTTTPWTVTLTGQYAWSCSASYNGHFSGTVNTPTLTVTVN